MARMQRLMNRVMFSLGDKGQTFIATWHCCKYLAAISLTPIFQVSNRISWILFAAHTSLPLPLIYRSQYQDLYQWALPYLWDIAAKVPVI